MNNFFKNFWKKVSIVFGLIVVVLSLQIATNANINAHTAITQAKSAAFKAKAAADEIASAEILRAKGSCSSSTQLRNLLDQLDALLIKPTNKNPEVIRAHEAIKAFTGNNPNCKNLPRVLP